MRPAIALPVLFLAGLAVAVAVWQFLTFWGLPGTFEPEAIKSWLEAGPLSPLLVLVVLMITAVIIGPIPTFPISASAGMLYGVGGGTLIAATGATIGAIIAFWIARWAARDWVHRRIGNHPLLDRDASQNTLSILIAFTRLVPVFSFALISYAAGLTAIQTWRFALASLVGMLPMTLVYAGLGHAVTVNPLVAAGAGLAIILIMWLVPPRLERRYGVRMRRWLRNE